MAGYRRVYDSRHLQAECWLPSTGISSGTLRSVIMDYLYLFYLSLITITSLLFKFFKIFNSCPWGRYPVTTIRGGKCATFNGRNWTKRNEFSAWATPAKPTRYLDFWGRFVPCTEQGRNRRKAKEVRKGIHKGRTIWERRWGNLLHVSEGMDVREIEVKRRL